MNRSTFIASTAAVVAAAAVPMASPAAVPEAAAVPIVYGARKLFAINGGPPWVVAESAAAALAAAPDSDFDVEPTATVTMFEPGKTFTMTYDDPPDESDCECDRAECTDEDGLFECECGEDTSRTLYAAEWAENRLDGEMVVGEYDAW
jgi:hypothetical protein